MEISVKYNATEQRVISLIAEQLSLPIEKVKHDSRFDDDLGADSLDMVELIMCFEEHFDCEVEDHDAERMVTVKDVFDYVEANKLGWQPNYRIYRPCKVAHVPETQQIQHAVGCGHCGPK